MKSKTKPKTNKAIDTWLYGQKFEQTFSDMLRDLGAYGVAHDHAMQSLIDKNNLRSLVLSKERELLSEYVAAAKDLPPGGTRLAMRIVGVELVRALMLDEVVATIKMRCHISEHANAHVVKAWEKKIEDTTSKIAKASNVVDIVRAVYVLVQDLVITCNSVIGDKEENRWRLSAAAAMVAAHQAWHDTLPLILRLLPPSIANDAITEAETVPLNFTRADSIMPRRIGAVLRKVSDEIVELKSIAADAKARCADMQAEHERELARVRDLLHQAQDEITKLKAKA